MKTFLGGKLENCFCVNYLCSNVLIGYADLLDFGKTLLACWSEIDAKNGCEALTECKIFFSPHPNA